jgi:hypothetical protein
VVASVVVVAVAYDVRRCKIYSITLIDRLKLLGGFNILFYISNSFRKTRQQLDVKSKWLKMCEKH